MKKIAIVLFCLCCPLAFAQKDNAQKIVLEIHNVTVNSGKLHTSASLNETSYKKRRPDLTYEFAPTGNVVKQEINLPIGECVINIYQDLNNNGKLDTGIFGIPKEPVGISNYNGDRPPGNFKKHKIIIDSTTATIVVKLHEL